MKELTLSFHRDLRAFCKGVNGLWEWSRLIRDMFLRVWLSGLYLCFLLLLASPPLSHHFFSFELFSGQVKANR